jgi:hypothetical protein
MPTTFLYRCPVTGHQVQGFIADNPTEKNGNVYEAFDCPICRRIHLVDPATGKVVGNEVK